MSLNRPSTTRRQSVRERLKQLVLGSTEPDGVKRNRLLLEALEKRQMLAGDVELLFTDGQVDQGGSPHGDAVSAVATGDLQATSRGEGEAAPDLVQFAKALADAGAQFFGSPSCEFCTEQKQLFEDGGVDLPFINVTNPDGTLNAIGQSENITSYPTWKFTDGTVRTGVLSLQTLSDLSGVSIPQGENPTFREVGNLTVQIGSPLHAVIDAYDPNGGPLTLSVTVDDPDLLEATVITGNRSIRFDMQGWGDMVFQTFGQRAPRPTGRFIELAEEGFYDGIIFHRVVDEFVIQSGDPTGTGAGGSSKGDFSDQFHPDLQHNREGVLSYAKAGDDTNDSQTFITEVVTRFLDYNHSVIGQQVEGFDVREAISETSTPESRGAGGSQRPDTDVTISTIDVFNDIENFLVMLKPTGSGTGSTLVTFTISDQDGNTYSETSQVNVVTDTSNSQPYLNDIPTPPATPINTVAQLQLSSVDVEGDAVSYFASSLSSASSGNVSVDSTSGLVEVTPANDFVGTINVQVGVRFGPGVVGNSASDRDTETVSFRFEGESVLTPSQVELQAASDSGSSNSDAVTNLGTLAFLVSGVTENGTVELIDTATDSVVGTALATGPTVVISTSNIAALGDGTYQIAARQSVGGVTSELSAPLTLIYDTTPPESVIGSAATEANVGRAYQTDLISTEEGSGLTYALTSAPDGATINELTGLINWTPTASQLGANVLTVETTDLAGNTRSEDLTINVGEAPTAEVRLEITDLDGNPLTTTSVGQEFLLHMFAVDARDNPRGVYGAFADILFDETLVRVVPGSTIEYADGFGLVQKGTFRPGEIDELGAVNSLLQASNLSENLIATARLQAVSNGIVNIRSENADEFDSEFLLFGLDNQLPPSAVAYGSVNLSIGQSFTLQDDSVVIDEDSESTTIDVLANDEATASSGALTVVSVTQPTSGGAVELNAGVVSFTPTSDFNGTVNFTYTASDTQGIQATANVTVTVVPINDPPSGQADEFNVDPDSTDNFLNVLGNDSAAPDSDETLTVIAIGSSTTSNGGSLSIASGGSGLIYSPAAGFSGIDTMSYTVSDGDLDQEVDVTVTVALPDNPPNAVDDAFTVTEDDGEAAFDVLANDVRDVDDQDFVIESIGTPSQGGSARISSDGLQLFYQPAANFAGEETVSYTIRDTGGGRALGLVTFTVTPINDPPPIANPVLSLNRGTSDNNIFSVADLPENVDDGETLTLSVTPDTAEGGTASVNSQQNEIIYTPRQDFVGTDTINYTVSDGSDLTSEGTITVEVTDYSTRKISINMPDVVTRTRIPGIILVGTDLLGRSVEIPVEYVDETPQFPELLPGNYTIEIPKIPFFQNGEEAKQIPVSSSPEDGDTTVDSDLGSLKAKHITIRDWLINAPKQSILTVVSRGESSLLATETPDSPVKDSSVSLDGSGSLLTIRGTQLDSEDPDATSPSTVQATVPATNDSRAQLRGEVDGLLLYRIDTERLIFSEVDTETNQGEGESVTPDALTLIDTSPPDQRVAPAPIPTTNSLTIGELQAEGESIVTDAVTRADLFVPKPDSVTARTDAAVLATPEADLWVGNSLQPASTNPVTSQIPSDSVSSVSIDSAMQAVSQEIDRLPEIGQMVSEQGSLDVQLDAEIIDQAFNETIR